MSEILIDGVNEMDSETDVVAVLERDTSSVTDPDSDTDNEMDDDLDADTSIDSSSVGESVVFNEFEVDASLVSEKVVDGVEVTLGDSVQL